MDKESCGLCEPRPVPSPVSQSLADSQPCMFDSRITRHDATMICGQDSKLPVASLFTGVGGFELGLSESNPQCGARSVAIFPPLASAYYVVATFACDGQNGSTCQSQTLFDQQVSELDVEVHFT